MIQRTHDLGAVAIVSYRMLAFPPPNLSLITLVGVGVTAIIGSLIPDIDNVASPAWKHRLLPWEGKATRDFLQGHRHLSHSILGLLVFTYIFNLLLTLLLIKDLDNNLLVQSFFLSQLSHLILDSLTIQGVPWLYPIPFKFGFPPFSFLRVKTGGWVEKLIVFPSILAATVWIFYSFRHNLPIILKGLQLN